MRGGASILEIYTTFSRTDWPDVWGDKAERMERGRGSDDYTSFYQKFANFKLARPKPLASINYLDKYLTVQVFNEKCKSFFLIKHLN